MRNGILAAALLGCMTLALQACGENPEPAESAKSSAEAIKGIEISDARLMLAPVAGNPAAIYFTLKNNGDSNIAFRSAEVDKAARAEIHDMMEMSGNMEMGEAPPVMVESAGEIAFEPGGKHIMVFDLPADFGPGDSAKVTLIAAGNHRHSFEVTARAAGDDR